MILTKEIYPKRRLYAQKEYQTHRPKTTEKTLFELELPAAKDQKRNRPTSIVGSSC